MSAGYSGTPLARKLGIGPGAAVQVVGGPAGYRARLAPLPDGVRFVPRLTASTDLVHLFCTTRAEYARALPGIRKKMRSDAVVWVSWPKRASGVETDMTEDTVREIALPLGLVDVKVCAVDDVWSGLKLVVRKSLR